MMTRHLFLSSMTILSVLCGLAGCSFRYDVQVSNPLDFDRMGEMVEIALSDVPDLAGCSFVIEDEYGSEVPYQLTHDSLIVFNANVPASGILHYTIRNGRPSPYDTLTCGSYRADRLDDFIWENDKSGYRTYGPALQAKGEKAYGYDVFTKSVPFPVMKERFDSALYSKNHPSFHIDHGNGMDSYGVGPTLGCGATALVHNDEIVYPWCWNEYEVMDNGPLRFCIRLKYSPVEVDGKAVVETRVITLDAGSHLNRVEVSYDGLPGEEVVAAGIVIHKENPDAYRLAPQYLAYADLGDRNIGQNGEIYCGVVFPEIPDGMAFVPFSKGADGAAVALGQIVATAAYAPRDVYEYYFGSAWSKGGMESLDAWEKYLSDYVQRIHNPVRTVISK